MMFVVIVDLAGSVDVRGQCCIFCGGVLSRGSRCNAVWCDCERSFLRWMIESVWFSQLG
jgi:hypothetical protein